MQGTEWYNKDFPLVMVSGPRPKEGFPGVPLHYVHRCLSRLFNPWQKPTLRQGGAQGVDRHAAIAAGMMGWGLEPDWKPKYNKHAEPQWKRVAPLRRTENMLDGVEGPSAGMWSPVPPDVLVVFRIGAEMPTGGTGHAVREARKRRIPMVIFELPEEDTDA